MTSKITTTLNTKNTIVDNDIDDIKNDIDEDIYDNNDDDIDDDNDESHRKFGNFLKVAALHLLVFLAVGLERLQLELKRVIEP